MAVRLLLAAAVFSLALGTAHAAAPHHEISGVVLTRQGESIAGVTVTLRVAGATQRTQTGDDGAFRFSLPAELKGQSVVLGIEAKYIQSEEKLVRVGDAIENLTLIANFVIPPVHESIVIVAAPLEPGVDRRNDSVYRRTLFTRDDQLLETLGAGINAGQHEGGGKSLEIRRFGFNLDHGGVSGGLKILVDGVQQNQGTQGHGQGYLGSLKSLTPELVDEVEVLDGPFRAEYGDFSGLGVVHIRLKESLPDLLTLRMQGGAVSRSGAPLLRGLIGFSPAWQRVDSFLAYEGSFTDGPFQNPLRYRRDNLTGNLTWRQSQRQSFGVKLNFGRNHFSSSGQIPLDEVAAGNLSRFGGLDPSGGGRVKSGTLGLYYRRELNSGAVLKLDGFLARSLFDLFSNFTFFLFDPANGDGIQQHDSRLQGGANAQYLRPFKFFRQPMLFTGGANYHDNGINVALYSAAQRVPLAVQTAAGVRVRNLAGFVQQGANFFRGKLHVEAGLRVDFFRFRVDDRVASALSGTREARRLQPKAALAWTPSERVPLTFYFNYGRGIATQDARGIVRIPDGPRISTADFYQAGISLRARRFSLAGDFFLIDRSNEQVYIPDDGTIELRGPSRSYGAELKSTVQITRALALGGGFTRVGNAFFRGASPRAYVDSAPHFVGNATLTLADWHGFHASLRYRHISAYRLDPLDPAIRAAGHDVIDLSLTRRLRRDLDLSVSVDNLGNKRYFETQNYFASRVRPGEPIRERIHATPGYPIGFTIGLTYRFRNK